MVVFVVHSFIHGARELCSDAGSDEEEEEGDFVVNEDDTGRDHDERATSASAGGWPVFCRRRLCCGCG